MRIRRVIGAGLLALIASVVWAGLLVERATAHALLVRSFPEADAELAQTPASIEMWFSEPLEAGFSRARLLTSSGQEAPTGAVILDPSDPTHMTLPLGQLEPGVYTVAWQTLSKTDGHEFYGAFPITVLNPDGARPIGEPAIASAAGRGDLPSLGETISRWLWLLGGVLLMGAPLFQYVVGPASRKPGQPLVEAAARDLTLKAIWVAALAVTVGHALQIVFQALRLGGLDQLPDLLLGTRTGALVLARQAMAFTGLLVSLGLPQPQPLAGREQPAFYVTAACDAVVLLLLVMAAVQGEYTLAVIAIVVASLGTGLIAWAPRNDPPALERRTWMALMALAGALLLSTSIGSHAGAAPGSFWAVLGDYIHLVAAAAWVGGLLLLPLLLWQVRRASEAKRADHQPLLLLVRRFSYLASFSVFVLTLTGLFNSLVELPDLPSLWETAYGRVLIIKLGLIALALGIAFLNNRLVHSQTTRRKDASQLQRLNRQVAVEAAVTLGLMMSVAVLVQTPAPRGLAPAATASQSSLPFNIVVNADDLYMHVQVAPNQVGNNRFWLHLFHSDGSPIGEVQLVQLRFDYRETPLGQASADLEPLGYDTYAVEGAYLSQTGLWDMSVYIRRRGLDDTLAQLSVDVPVPSAEVTTLNPWQYPIPALPPILLAAWGLMALGVIPILWRQSLEAKWPQLYLHFRRTAVLLLILGLVINIAWLLGFGGESSAGSPDGNPIPSSAASLEQGQALYEENCLPCHGPVGLGDGPVSFTLNPRPANLQVHMIPGVHTDEQIFEWITNGFPNSLMPAFNEVLTEDERWHVLNYTRTLIPQ